jgi:uncharacterized paraquat-inducible protein A
MENKPPAMISDKPMTCPECARSVTVEDVQAGRCPHCRTKIRVPKRFKTKVKVAMAPTTLLIVLLGMVILPSGSHSYPYLFLCYAGTAICGFIWMIIVSSLAYWLMPPKIERDIGEFVRLDLS